MRTYTPEQLSDIGDLAVIELKRRQILADKDIKGWGRHYFPEKFTLGFCSELHDYLIEVRLEDFTDTIAPRGHAKTTIQCFLIPTYQGYNEPSTYHHYLNIQATATKAVNVNLDIRREVVNNEKLRRDYGDMMSPDKFTERQFIMRNGVIFSAVGAGESLRGIAFNNERPDYVIVDDLYDEDERNNRDSIEKKNEWLLNVAYPARSKVRHSSFHVQGTVMNPADILHVLQKKDGVRSKVFQAITDFKKEIVLWPQLNSFKQLMTEREFIGSINFAREYQGECRDESSSIVKDAWIKYAKSIPETHKIERVIGGCDPSIGDKENSDLTGNAVVIQTTCDGSKFWYVAHARGQRATMQERIALWRGLGEIHKLNQLRVESIAGFKDFTAEMRRTTNLPVVEITRVKDKITNLERHSSKFENGKVIVLTTMPDKDRIELVDQLINNYPNHDDVRDAVLLCLDDTKNQLRVGVI